MTKYIFRFAQEFDYDEVAKHLLVVGDLSGDCFSCRHIGIDYTREKYCPQCKTDFKFIAYRRLSGAVTGAQVSRICQKRPDLTYVEFNDIKEIADRQKAKNIFK
jgi:hypothetical protein